MMVVFTATDRLQHLFWPPEAVGRPAGGDNVVLRAYQQVDWAIAQTRGLIAPDTTVILMSDHGFTYLQRLIHVNQLFSDMGLLAAEDQGRSLLQRAGVTRQNVGRLARRLGLDRIRAHIPDAAKQIVPIGEFGLDMTHTRAYSWSAGEVFINLRDREPQGIVAPGEEYEALRNRIIERLETLTDNGRRLDIRVFKREEIFSGKYLQNAPDLMIDVREPGYGLANRHTGMEVSEILPGVIFSDYPGRGGRHDTDGIFVALGPHIQKGAVIEDAEIIDITPTVLHAMGHPVPDDMDGRVLPIFEEGSPPVNRLVQRAPAEEEEVEEVLMTEKEQERLHTLLQGFGYLG